MKFIRALTLAVVCMLLLGSLPTGAAEFVPPDDKDSGRVLLSSQKEYKNLYTAGASVQVNSKVLGDLFAAGSDITLDGEVEADVNVAGGTVAIQNKVGGDVRVASGNIKLNNEVGGDVLAAGGQISMSEKAKVGGDVVVAGGQILIDSPVAGKVWVTGGSVTINSAISGELVVKNADKVTFGPKAQVLGKAKVSAKEQPVLQEGSAVPNLEYTAYTPSKKEAAAWASGILAVGVAIAFLGYILIGLLVSWVAPRKAEDFVLSLKNKFWMNLGLGIAGLVVAPIVAIVAMVVLIGIYAGLALLVVYAAALFLAWIMGLVFVGSFSTMLLKRGKVMEVSWRTALVGAIVYAVLKLVPVVGALVIFGVVMAAFGQWMYMFSRHVVERGSRTVAE